MTNTTEETQVRALLDKLPRLRQEIGKVIIGQRKVVEELLTAFLAGGHCRLQGLPGLGKTYPLERPFFVLATQNPIEQAGTYPLPEAQLDRFLLYVTIGYPEETDEFTMLAQTTGQASAKVEPVMNADEIRRLQSLAREVAISEAMVQYVGRLVRATRDKSLPWGAGPRAGQALILASKARALLAGRFAVTPEDLRALAAPVLRHRILLNFEAEGENITTDDVAKELFKLVPEPKGRLS